MLSDMPVLLKVVNSESVFVVMTPRTAAVYLYDYDHNRLTKGRKVTTVVKPGRYITTALTQSLDCTTGCKPWK